VETAGPEPATSAGDAKLVEVVPDRLQALWWPIPTKIQVENALHEAGLDLVDDQHLLVLVATAFLYDRGIAEGRVEGSLTACSYRSLNALMI